MYAAVFEMDSMFGKMQYFFKGRTPRVVMIEFEDVQSLDCLIQHGRYEEDADGQLALDRLEEIYNKYSDGTITMDDIASINVKISIGAIKCLAVAEGKEAVASLKEQYPKAMGRN